MQFKHFAIVAFAAFAFAQGAKAQNLQVFYDFGDGREYVTTTFEMFKADKFGDTFWFIDHNYNSTNHKNASYFKGASSAVNASYFEIERGINFWQDSKLKDLSAHIEYDGSTWGAGIWCFGAKYFLHSEDFSKTFTLALMYDLHRGYGEADIPVKFSGVWGLNDLFGVKGLVFKGFIDVWGNNAVWGPDDETKFSVLTEPQLWYNLGDVFDGHLDVGTEVELSVNFAGHKGFMCNPCAGLRWTF